MLRMLQNVFYLSFYSYLKRQILFIESDKKSAAYHKDNEIHENKAVY